MPQPQLRRQSRAGFQQFDYRELDYKFIITDSKNSIINLILELISRIKLYDFIRFFKLIPNIDSTIRLSKT